MFVEVGIDEKTDEPNPLMASGAGSLVSTLRFVNLNALVVKEGQGFVPVYFPFREKAAFLRHERAAAAARKGIWRTSKREDRA